MNVHSKPPKILLSKIGLDTHTRGLKVVAYFLRDAGMEVIYLGPYQTAEVIVRVAIDEDVDVIGISALEGSEVPHIEHLMQLLQKAKLGDRPVIVGGIIPKRDEEALRKMAVSDVFPAGTPMAEVVRRIQNLCASRTKG